MAKGGKRVWDVCKGSGESAKFIVEDDGVGECRECGRILSVYKSGVIVRHKGRD